MSLATRCTACGTVFRVVQDQLKISEGWVRCGRCKQVFNALESLVELDADAPVESHAIAPVGLVESAPQRPRLTAADDATPASAALLRRADEPEAPAHQGATNLDVDLDERGLPLQPVDAEPEPEAPFIEPSWAVSAMPADAARPDDAQPASAEAAQAEPAAPAFMRQRRRARLRNPEADRPWLIATAGLLMLLALQMLVAQRDAIVATVPATRPLLAVACWLVGCKIEAPKRIEDVAVESSSLVRADSNPDSSAMRLSVVLRNKGTTPLAMPTIDLSLTDTNGSLVARRALPTSEFSGAGSTLAPSAETNLQLLLSTQGKRVAGYTVEVFYP